MPLWPQIDLKHTVETTAGLIKARGKVSQINHSIDINKRFAETSVKLSLSKSIGTQTNSPINTSISTPPIIGEALPDKIIIDAKGSESFEIKTPDIDALSRDTQEYNQSKTLNVQIPNDKLEVTF